MTNWTADEVPRLDDEVVVVTGANSGLGFEATKVFAWKGATVVMACRSVERGEDARDEIREAFDEADQGGDPGDLDVRECDLASLDSVESFTDGVRTEYDAVKILCNNAGVMAVPRSETEDGFETQLGVNHFGHFALTGHLLPALAASDGEARVVTQSSGLHERGTMDFTDLDWEDSYDKWDAYGRSKLANLLFAYELDRRLADHDTDDVVSVGCHPGYAATNLQSRAARDTDLPGYGWVMKMMNKILAQSAADGTLPMLYAATATDEVSGGDYVGPDGFGAMRGSPVVQPSSEASNDEDDARELWDISTERTGVSYPFAELTPKSAE